MPIDEITSVPPPVPEPASAPPASPHPLVLPPRFASIPLDPSDKELILKILNDTGKTLGVIAEFKIQTGLALRSLKAKYAKHGCGTYCQILNALGFLTQRANAWIEFAEKWETNQAKAASEVNIEITEGELQRLESGEVDPQATAVNESLEKAKQEVASKEHEASSKKSGSKSRPDGQATFKASKLHPDDVLRVKDAKLKAPKEFELAVREFAHQLGCHGAAAVLHQLKATANNLGAMKVGDRG